MRIEVSKCLAIASSQSQIKMIFYIFIALKTIVAISIINILDLFSIRLPSLSNQTNNSNCQNVSIVLAFFQDAWQSGSRVKLTWKKSTKHWLWISALFIFHFSYLKRILALCFFSFVQMSRSAFVALRGLNHSNLGFSIDLCHCDWTRTTSAAWAKKYYYRNHTYKRAM